MVMSLRAILFSNQSYVEINIKLNSGNQLILQAHMNMHRGGRTTMKFPDMRISNLQAIRSKLSALKLFDKLTNDLVINLQAFFKESTCGLKETTRLNFPDYPSGN
jgi:hypothetical protein